MVMLQKAIEEITYFSDIFPEEEFQVITANKEEAVPYLREAVEYVLRNRTELEEDYQLYFYAIYLLAEFGDRESFPRIVELASLPDREADALLGDCITSDLSDILYNTFDGNLELLERTIKNADVNVYVRAAMLDVVGQLYLDGILQEGEWKDFLRQNVYCGREYDYLYDAVGCMLCQCHFYDMLPEIRYMFENNLLDEISMGKYDSYVDAMFEYRENEKAFCRDSFYAADTLRGWAMFREEPEKEAADKKDFAKMLCKLDKERGNPGRRVKTGRNDPCPCGSGKKYKFCCLNKPADEMDLIESLEERGKCLKSYPYTGQERVEGRIYLADYFDEVSIEIDKILYLALMNRPAFIWNRNKPAEEKRMREYLYLAYQKLAARMKEEQIRTFAEYDEKYSIHYRCEEWTDSLCELLKKNYEIEKYNEVAGFIAERNR